LEADRREAPQMVITDWMMPEMDGLDLCRRLRADEENGFVYLLLLTAQSEKAKAVEALDAGADDFLAKPFTPDELRGVVRKAAGRILLQRQARRLAEEKRRVRFEFVRVLAHELKSPLAAIEGYLNICADPAMQVGEEKRLEMTKRCLERLAGMRQLILGLLDLTRIESGEKQRELAEVELVAVARECVESIAPQAAGRGIAIDLDAPGRLPLWADRGELSIIVNNLVSNAVKYNRDGGRVVLRLARRPEGVEIAVSDTGIGMTEGEAGRLFREFSRIRNSRTAGISGSGLGLSILKKLAELYRGEVSVKSVPEQGSTFTVLLRDVNPPTEKGKP